MHGHGLLSAVTTGASTESADEDDVKLLIRSDLLCCGHFEPFCIVAIAYLCIRNILID